MEMAYVPRPMEAFNVLVWFDLPPCKLVLPHDRSVQGPGEAPGAALNPRCSLEPTQHTTGSSPDKGVRGCKPLRLGGCLSRSTITAQAN